MTAKLDRPPFFTATSRCPCGAVMSTSARSQEAALDRLWPLVARHDAEHAGPVVECLSTPSTLWAAS